MPMTKISRSFAAQTTNLAHFYSSFRSDREKVSLFFISHLRPIIFQFSSFIKVFANLDLIKTLLSQKSGILETILLLIKVQQGRIVRRNAVRYRYG